MAQDAQTETRYRWIGIGVASGALLGWLLAVYFWTAWAGVTSELERHQALSGTEAETEIRVAALRSEEGAAVAGRDERAGELDQLAQRLDETRTELATLEDRTQDLREEHGTLETELVQGRDELAGLEGSRTQTQQKITDATQELSEVGGRLEEARNQDAELQSGLAALAAKVSQLTNEAADAQERVQAARDAEASLAQQVVLARQELEEIESKRDGLERSVAALAQQREELAADTSATEDQLTAIQAVVADAARMLAERSEQLSVLEARITEAQNNAGSTAGAETAGLVTGTRYSSGSVVAIFNSDGTFQMTNGKTTDTAAGNYDLSAGSLTLSEVDGDLRFVEFPMRCAIRAREAGFLLEDADGSCSVLAGAEFVEDTP